MLVSWRWRLVVALVGLVLFLSPSGVAAKIERFKDNEGTLHISNTGEVPVKPGGATTPSPPSTPTPPPRPVPPPPMPVPPPPPDDQGEAPPIMERVPNEPQPEPPAEQPAPEAGNDGAGHQAQAEPNAGSGQPETAQPPIRKIPGPGGRGRGALAR